MKSTLWLIPFVLVLVACNKEAAPPVKIERPALTQLVGALNGEGSMVYSGEIRARHETTLGFRLAGKLIERPVEAGTLVKAGQVLARLDPADAGLQASSANAQYTQARDEVARYRELHNKGFVSQSALDVRETALKAAAAQAGLTRHQADYTTLRAGRDGVVAATLAEVGQVVGTGQPVLRIAEAGEREVAISIPEAQYGSLKVGDKAQVMVLSGVLLTGRLRELSPAADPASRTYPARVSLASAAAQPALGMTARVSFEGPKSPTRELLIPLSAIYQQGSQTAVWTVSADRHVSLRPVQVASYRDGGAVIASGLAVGERIVSAGVHRLTAGETIQLIDRVDVR